MMKEALFQATAQTFEELGFLQPIPETGEPRLESSSALASVKFSGCIRGRVELIVTNALLPIVTANMLGIEGNPSLNQQFDALCEMANVTAAHFLTEFAGIETVFDLTPPQISFGTDHKADVPLAACQTTVLFDEGTAEVRLYIDNTTAPEGNQSSI